MAPRTPTKSQTVLSSYFSPSPAKRGAGTGTPNTTRASSSSSAAARRVDVDLTRDSDDNGDDDNIGDDDDSDAELWRSFEDAAPPAKKRKIIPAPAPATAGTSAPKPAPTLSPKPTAAAAASARTVPAPKPAVAPTASAPPAKPPLPAFFAPKPQPTPNAAPARAEAVAVQQPAVAEDAALQQYRFAAHEPGSPEPTQAADDAAKRRWRERAKRILLADKNVLERRLTGAVEGGAAQEDNGEAEDEDADGDGEEGEEEEDDGAKSLDDVLAFYVNSGGKGKGKAAKGKGNAAAQAKKAAKKAEVGPSGQTWTPLELQVLELKKRHPGTLLMFEVGYKIIFYGEDAQVAAKHLGIVCYPKRNFLNATVPVHRREVHLKKLLSQGLKVGIVEQTETAALKKAGESRNDLFARRLTRLYTAATYVDALDSVDALDPTAVPPLVCVVESPAGGPRADERVRVSVISVCASTGDVVWDHFDDNHMRTELETRLVHIAPAELLLPETGLSRPTEKMLLHFAEHSHAEFKVRTERFKKTMTYGEAFDSVTSFYSDKTKAGQARASEGFKSGQLTAAIAYFPQEVVIALAHLVKYLSTFDVADALLETRFFSKFTERTHMLLNGNTLTHLEIFRNETDYTKRGSLLWILDHTTTKFGARMLKDWIGRPLTDKAALTARTDAIAEILATDSPRLTVLRHAMRGLPDLARGLARIQYGTCTPPELAALLPAFDRLARAFDRVPAAAPRFASALLNAVADALPRVRAPVKELLAAVRLPEAREGNVAEMWADPERFPELEEYAMGIQIVESELMDELRRVRKELRRPALQYATVNGEEYLIEIKKADLPDIPAQWRVVSATRSLRRLRTPTMVAKLEQRAQLQEARAAAASTAYRAFLAGIAHAHYALLRDAVAKVAAADCLCSLATVALEPGFVRPTFLDDADADGGTLEIEDGRHPMIEKLRDAPVIPNSVSTRPQRHKVITGPNMGGKSSVVRMIALCAIMAQIGAYVPAAAMRTTLHDAILIRMGAADDLARGRSTFMVELQETSDILRAATPRSLVVLDELGRGTSTFDGMAIAHAVLQHLVASVRCTTLFITHYPPLARALAAAFPAAVQNLHVGYAEHARADGSRAVVFLYRLAPGLAAGAFGFECARLAGLPEGLLQRAQERADAMQELVEGRMRRNRARRALELVQRATSGGAPAQTVVTELTSIANVIPSVRP